MSIYIGNDLEDRLEVLEVENTLLKKNTGKLLMKLIIRQT